MKMLEKYTYIRQELQNREEMLNRAITYTTNQEGIINELRGFIEDILWTDADEPDPVDVDRVAKKKRRYRNRKVKCGKAHLDRILHKDKDDFFKFGL